MDYDIVVIGAGIHGAAVAQAGAAAGWRVLVLEQYPQPAAGTSSKSSKLIHGGLRYLESGRLRLVRECLVERERLLRNAPHLVQLKPFHIPVYEDTARRSWKIALGLSLYALLGGKGFSSLPRSQWSHLDGLRNRGLQRVFRYHDAQTDDAALTRAVLASAESLGAEVRTGCRFQHADCDHRACRIVYRQQDVTHSLQAAILVNTAGPWVNRVLETIQPPSQKPPVELVQGTHLLLRGELKQGMYYLEAPQDGRAVFVMPWKQQILLGTTETLYHGDPAQVRPLDKEIDYLLTVYNHYFAAVDTRAIVDAFAGLRVLPQAAGVAFHRSRDTLLYSDKAHNARVLSLYGGKLTAYRATGERVLEKLRPLLPERKAQADTRTLRLPEIE
ncbi:MAG: FAD-dependent oxidoreductase [Thiogranum sp.]|nr:FAD-dependent oxidoreductase [Thiogranum sp.]